MIQRVTGSRGHGVTVPFEDPDPLKAQVFPPGLDVAVQVRAFSPVIWQFVEEAAT